MTSINFNAFKQSAPSTGFELSALSFTDGGEVEERLPAGPRMGDRFETLPADSKEIVLKGEKLYLSPSGFYYKEVIDGNKLLYEVVGK